MYIYVGYGKVLDIIPTFLQKKVHSIVNEAE